MLATPDDLEALDPPKAWDDKPDVLVVGGGVIGLCGASFCRREGLRVLLIEKGRLARCASGRAAGGLGPDAHPELGEAWHDLARRSLELHRELDAEWGYGLRSIDLLVPPDLRIPDQAHVDPLRFAAALARNAGTIATGTEFEFSHSGGGRVVSVLTSAGVVHPGTVVFAMGPTPPHLPFERHTLIKGHLIATEPAGFALDELVTDGEILVLQLPDDSLVAGGTKDRDDVREGVDTAVVERVRARMSELVPAAAGLETTHEWTCFRPCTPDELPMIDAVPGLSNAWFAAGLYSTGILMAPVVGRLLADWITGSRPEALIPFAIGRSRN